jgi:hypothetical protein
MPRPLAVLVLYMHTTALPMRPTMASQLRFLERGSERHQILYFNLAGRLPQFIRQQRYDLVVLHYSVLAARWTPRFERIREATMALRASGALVVAMPQDEYDEAHVLDDWIVDLGTDVVFSIFDGGARDALYPRATRSARFEQCLTGYLDEADQARLADRTRAHPERRLDIAYRAGWLPYRLGSHGQIKHRLALAFGEAAPRHGLAADVATTESSVMFGGAWLDFLASSRCVLGCESGASAMDPRGVVRALEARLRAADPTLTFEQFARQMPAGWDGHPYTAVSPRHFEATLAGACQLLVRGHYDGVLEPELHYLPLAADLSDVDEACERARDSELTGRVAARAFADVVASGRYTYSAFARRFEDVVFPLAPAGGVIGPQRARRAVAAASALHDQVVVRGRPRLYWWAYAQVGRRAPRVLAAVAAVRRRVLTRGAPRP